MRGTTVGSLEYGLYKSGVLNRDHVLGNKV